MSGSPEPFALGELPAAMTPDVLRALFEQSPVSKVVYDAAGHILAVNRAFERLFGLTLASIPRDYSVLHDAELERAGHLPAVRRAFAGEPVVLPLVRYDASTLDESGRTTWTQGHFSPMRAPNGDVTGVLLVHVDLTARVEAEEARRLGDERLRLALDAGRLGTWDWDIESGRVHWSDALLRIYGLESRDFGGTLHDYESRLHPDDRERVLTHMARSLEGEPHWFEHRIVQRDGAVRWLEARGELFRDAAGRPLRMLGVCADVTERKLAEAEAEDARQRLEQQAAELSLRADELQMQAMELEAQQEELEEQRAELEVVNGELQQTNVELAAARELAERAEEYVRSILGSIGDPFVVLDSAWRFRYVNEAARLVFAGGGHLEPVGLVVWEAYPDLVGTRFEREMRRAAAERVPVTFTEFRAATGHWAETRCYPVQLASGLALAALWRDVTGQKQAEEARHYLARAGELLAQSLDREETVQELAQLLVPQLGDWCSIHLLDDAGILRQVAVAHVDPAKVQWARELYERYPPDPERPYGAHWVARTGQPAFFPEIPEAMLVAVAQDAEHLRIIREIGFASALTVPLAARGHVLGVMSLITTSESGRRYGEAELSLAHELASRAALALDNAALYGTALRARSDAEEANRAKADFLATMSHELRTPLNAIGGYAQLIELGVHGPVTAAQQEALERIQRSQQHLLSLINDVLNFAKLEAGRVTYDVQPVAVDRIVAGLEALVAPQLAAKSLGFACDAGDPSLVVRADAEKAGQILLNLLSNAIKFTPAAGAVRVRTWGEDDRVHVAVSDTGIGIASDKLEAIFEPFVQIERMGLAGQEGTGLGLAISRDLARAMGGELTVVSTPGVGSSFTLTLRRA